MNALLVDDEPLARVHLRRMLEAQGVQVVGEAEDAPTGLQMAEDLRPDVLFLDIQLPGLSGMQMAGALLQLDAPPLVIFVTGYSEHALAAFEQDALDYLVKPVAPDRLARALTRARARLADKEARRQTGQGMQYAAQDAPLRRLPIREDYAVRLVRIEEILYAAAAEKRVMIRTSAGEHRTYYTLKQLEQLLPADRFFRVHESVIVNLDHVEELIFLGSHSYALKLDTGATLPVSKSRFSGLQAKLGVGR